MDEVCGGTRKVEMFKEGDFSVQFDLISLLPTIWKAISTKN